MRFGPSTSNSRDGGQGNPRTPAAARSTADALLPLVYDELRALARRYLKNEAAQHTLQATALVHEAYLRLAGDDGVQWQNRAQFYSAAATAIRRILIDYARSRGRAKRGGAWQRTALHEASTVFSPAGVDLLSIDDALTKLAAIDADKARVVELRFFAGLSIEQTAEVMNVSPSTVSRAWRVARAWLRREVSRDEDACTAGIGADGDE